MGDVPTIKTIMRTIKSKVQKEDLTDYIDISWYMLCEDYNLPYGDISPQQQSRVDDAVEEINKVLIEFVKQNSVNQ